MNSYWYWGEEISGECLVGQVWIRTKPAKWGWLYFTMVSAKPSKLWWFDPQCQAVFEQWRRRAPDEFDDKPCSERIIFREVHKSPRSRGESRPQQSIGRQASETLVFLALFQNAGQFFWNWSSRSIDLITIVNIFWREGKQATANDLNLRHHVLEGWWLVRHHTWYDLPAVDVQCPTWFC